VRVPRRGLLLYRLLSSTLAAGDEARRLTTLRFPEPESVRGRSRSGRPLCFVRLHGSL